MHLSPTSKLGYLSFDKKSIFWHVFVRNVICVFVGPVSVFCDGVGCHVPCLRHGISVWQHIGQSMTATSRHPRDMTSDVSKRR